MKLLDGMKNVYFIGIKGTGMSALAVNLKSLGFKVAGSDYNESFFTDSLLQKHGIKVLSPFSAENIPHNTDLVVVSTAYNNKNAEWQEAEKRGLKILTYPEVIGLLSQELPSVAICGSHGKTTTSGALAYLLSKTSYWPIVNVGSIVPQLAGYRAQKPKLFVFEADEYQNKFRYFKPRIVILTNIDYDHPDFFRNPNDYKTTFKKFVQKIPRNGLLIYCADDTAAREAAESACCKKIGYGFSKHAQTKVAAQKIVPSQMAFSLSKAVNQKAEFKSKLIGEHNALNLAAVIVCAEYLKVPAGQIKKAVASFAGTKRRLETTRHLHINGHPCIVIDDFGHHPTEIKATIITIKSAYPAHTLWTVFQPHTFSRTEALFDDFAKCFIDSDKTVILDICASKRETDGKIHSRDLVKKMKGEVYYQPDIMQAATFLKQKIKSPGIILTIGASNVWQLSQLL